MGNEQTTQKPTPKLNPEKGEELNGHAVLNPDSAEPDHNKEEPVAEKTESPAVSVKNDPKQLEELVVDSSDTSGPKCLEVSGQKTTITPAAEPPKTASKPSTDEVSSFFGKVFKKKPVQQASETSDAVDAPVVVDLKIDMEPDDVFNNLDQNEMQVADPFLAQSIISSSAKDLPSMEAESKTCLDLLLDYTSTHCTQSHDASFTRSIDDELLTFEASKVTGDEEEQSAVDAERALMEDKELLQIVESILSEENEDLYENQATASEDLMRNAEESSRPVQEERFYADDVLQIAIGHEDSEELLEELVEEPLTSSIEMAMAAEEEPVDSTRASGGPRAVDESWEIIEETQALPRRVSCSGESAELFSQLRSMCIQVLEDASYSPGSVDVCADESSIHISIELCLEEFRKDPVEIKNHTEAELEAQALQDVTEEKKPAEEQKTAEKSVMNFFKTLASPAKTSKEAQVTADASKEQTETPPAPATNEAPKAPPPPPPPAPPKLEGKAEPVLKKEETPAAKEPAKTKDKSKSSGFSKLFRSKVLPGKAAPKVEMISANGGQVETSGVPVKVEEKKPVEVKAEPVEVEGEKPEVNAEPVEVEEKKPEVNAEVDASKTSTLEAGASAPKAEEPPAPEEKKPEKKSTFGKLFKPKVLLGQVSSRIQAAASSAAASFTLASAGAATVAKKETAASTPAPAAAAEAAPPAKPKEDPKAAAAAPSAAQPAPDSKSETSTNGASPNIPRKMEKRNSLQLFFKNLGPKRQSDGGAQPDAPAAATEKAK